MDADQATATDHNVETSSSTIDLNERFPIPVNHESIQLTSVPSIQETSDLAMASLPRISEIEEHPARSAAKNPAADVRGELSDTLHMSRITTTESERNPEIKKLPCEPSAFSKATQNIGFNAVTWGVFWGGIAALGLASGAPPAFFAVLGAGYAFDMLHGAYKDYQRGRSRA